MTTEQETVYLLHFNQPYRHARHYLGHAADDSTELAEVLDARLKQHAAGNGARLLQVITQAGITWQLARTLRAEPQAEAWPGGRDLERRLKRQKNSPRLCPLCQNQFPNSQLSSRACRGTTNSQLSSRACRGTTNSQSPI